MSTKSFYILHDDTGIAGVYTSRKRAEDASDESTSAISVVPISLLDKPLGVTDYTPPSAAVISYGEAGQHDTMAASMAAQAFGWKDDPEYVDTYASAVAAYDASGQESIEDLMPPFSDDGAAQPKPKAAFSADIDLG